MAEKRGLSPARWRLIGCLGGAEHSIDEKGRVSIPAPFRQVLVRRRANVLVVTNFVCDGSRCLEAFSLETWKALEARVAKRSRFDPQLQKFENFYLARAVECPVDGSGRITVPGPLRVYAELEREVVFAAVFDGFRLWNRSTWEMVFREAEQMLVENPALFVDLRS